VAVTIGWHARLMFAQDGFISHHPAWSWLVPDTYDKAQIWSRRTEASRDGCEPVTGQQDLRAAVAKASDQLVLGKACIQGHQHCSGPGRREEADKVAI